MSLILIFIGGVIVYVAMPGTEANSPNYSWSRTTEVILAFGFTLIGLGVILFFTSFLTPWISIPITSAVLYFGWLAIYETFFL